MFFIRTESWKLSMISGEWISVGKYYLINRVESRLGSVGIKSDPAICALLTMRGFRLAAWNTLLPEADPPRRWNVPFPPATVARRGCPRSRNTPSQRSTATTTIFRSAPRNESRITRFLRMISQTNNTRRGPRWSTSSWMTRRWQSLAAASSGFTRKWVFSNTLYTALSYVRCQPLGIFNSLRSN